MESPRPRPNWEKTQVTDGSEPGPPGRANARIFRVQTAIISRTKKLYFETNGAGLAFDEAFRTGEMNLASIEPGNFG